MLVNTAQWRTVQTRSCFAADRNACPAPSTEVKIASRQSRGLGAGPAGAKNLSFIMEEEAWANSCKIKKAISSLLSARVSYEGNRSLLDISKSPLLVREHSPGHGARAHI